MWNKLLIICCLISLLGCKAKKQLIIKDTVSTQADLSKKEQIASMESLQIDFSTFSGRARTQLGIDGKSNDVTLNIRIKKDQRIWISVTAIAGLEVARALITPDSIKVINRLEGAYLEKPFSFIHQYTSDQINYKTLESLLIGNFIPEQVNTKASIKTDSTGIILTGNLKSLAYELTFNEALKVTSNLLNNTEADQSLQIKNSNFRKIESRIFPDAISISSKVENKQFSIGLQYIRTEFDLPDFLS
jgi:hypothetical protein